MCISAVTSDTAGRVISWIEEGYTFTVSRDTAGRPLLLRGASPGRKQIVAEFKYSGAGGAFSGVKGELAASAASHQSEVFPTLLRDAMAAGNVPVYLSGGALVDQTGTPINTGAITSIKTVNGKSLVGAGDAGLVAADVGAAPAGTGAGGAVTASDTGALTQTLADARYALISALTNVWIAKGSIDASANPNYPAATAGWVYVTSVAGKIGGYSGKSVEVGDFIFCNTTNAGGTDAAVGASWNIFEHNLIGALLAANNLSDVQNTATARANLGAAPAGTGTGGAITAADTGAVALDTVLVSGTWAGVPSLSRLRVTGTGALSVDSRDKAGNVTTAVFSSSYTATTETIEFPFYGASAVQIRATFPNTLTVEVI